jgi:hypothetical protein
VDKIVSSSANVNNSSDFTLEYYKGIAYRSNQLKILYSILTMIIQNMHVIFSDRKEYTIAGMTIISGIADHRFPIFVSIFIVVV